MKSCQKTVWENFPPLGKVIEEPAARGARKAHSMPCVVVRIVVSEARIEYVSHVHGIAA
jgi:hypothetical protein